MLPLLLVNMNASTRVGPFDRLSAGYLARTQPAVIWGARLNPCQFEARNTTS